MLPPPPPPLFFLLLSSSSSLFPSFLFPPLSSLPAPFRFLSRVSLAALGASPSPALVPPSSPFAAAAPLPPFSARLVVCARCVARCRSARRWRCSSVPVGRWAARRRRAVVLRLCGVRAPARRRVVGLGAVAVAARCLLLFAWRCLGRGRVRCRPSWFPGCGLRLVAWPGGAGRAARAPLSPLGLGGRGARRCAPVRARRCVRRGPLARARVAAPARWGSPVWAALLSLPSLVRAWCAPQVGGAAAAASGRPARGRPLFRGHFGAAGGRRALGSSSVPSLSAPLSRPAGVSAAPAILSRRHGRSLAARRLDRLRPGGQQRDDLLQAPTRGPRPRPGRRRPAAMSRCSAAYALLSPPARTSR